MARFELTMSVEDVLMKMADGNPGALSCLIEFMNADPISALNSMMILDDLDIYGTKVYILWNDCCGRDINKFKETIKRFWLGEFTKEQIHENLSQTYGTPFIWFHLIFLFQIGSCIYAALYLFCIFTCKISENILMYFCKNNFERR